MDTSEKEVERNVESKFSVGYISRLTDNRWTHAVVDWYLIDLRDKIVKRFGTSEKNGMEANMLPALWMSFFFFVAIEDI